MEIWEKRRQQRAMYNKWLSEATGEMVWFGNETVMLGAPADYLIRIGKKNLVDKYYENRKKTHKKSYNNIRRPRSG